MPRHRGAGARAAMAWLSSSSWCRKRNPLVFLGCASLFAFLHLFASSGGLGGILLAANLDRRETVADIGVDGGMVHSRLDGTGYRNAVPAWPAPPFLNEHGDRGHFKEGDFPVSFRAYQEHKVLNNVAEGITMVPAKPLAESHPAQETLTEKQPGAPFPWPELKKVTPNYFLHQGNSSSGTVTARFDAKNSILVYLHHNKAAGTTTKNCLTTIGRAGIGRFIGPLLTSEGRLAVEMRFVRNRPFMMRSMPNTYVGGYAFGVCDRFRKPCAYFTVMRDPYDRTLSSHQYCKRARLDQLCAAQVAGNVSLREWAIHQGSFFFRQLLFQPEFCSDRTQWEPYINVNNVPHEFLRNRDSMRGAPCWFRQKLIMNLTLSSAEREALLQYCLDNLERWFAVIMLVDRYDESLQMAEEAFKLPMHDLCTGRHDNIGAYNITHGEPADLSQNRTSAAKPSASEAVQKQLLELRRDPEVRRVLRADELLYKKGVEIFNRQLEMFNKMKSRT